MRLAKQAWPSTFHLLVLMSISSFLGLSTIVDAHTGLEPPQRKREYTVAFRGVDNGASLFSVSNSAVVKKKTTLHPVYEAREFLVEHNTVRKQFGEPPLVWDRTLAHYARRFAGERAVNCDMIHTTDSPYGENIYWGANYFKHTAAAAVRAWAGEIHDYNPLTNTCSPSKLCGHYKQIVWRTSSKVGCARVKCNNGGVFIICAYDPPGNYENESPFDIPVIVQGPPQSSQTPPTPAAQTKTPPTPSAQTKTPPSPASQTKTPTSLLGLSAPTTLLGLLAPTKTSPTPASQTRTPTSPSAQSKTAPTPGSQTRTPTSPSAQSKTAPTPASQTKTPTSPSATPVHTTLITTTAHTTPTSPSTPS